MKNQSDWEILLSLEGIIFNLDKISVDQSVKSIINKFDHDYPESFNNIVAHMVYENLVIKMNNADTYFDFLNKIEMFEERNNIKSKILKVFTHILQNKNTKEAYFLFDYMIEHNILELKKFKFIGPVQEPYFVHYLSKEEIKNKEQYLKANFSKYDELSKNDWALHKKLIKEGVNPSELAKIIRNDDLEKLQEISSQNDFNFDQCIIPSLYERCSFINCLVSLIDYAAFFGSIKCFKYLLLNGAKVNNTGKYAIAGGNLEIIHLCVQNHSSFKDAYETAIEFHRNDVFHYIYENKMVIIQNIEELGKKCTLYHNYEILSYLIEKGLKILDFFVFYVAQNYNLYLTRYLLENKNKVNVMFFTAKAGNYEIMKYFIEQEKMDITVKNV